MTEEKETRRFSPDQRREQAVEIAKLFHQERLTATEIIDHLPERLRPSSVRTVYRRLREAYNYVDVIVSPREPTPVTAPIETEDDLARTLAAELGFADALVLRSVPMDEDDDAAQVRLGTLAARYAASQIGDHDMIGVGPGRGVWNCVNALAYQARLRRLNGLRVVSLAGTVALWGPLSRLDADSNTDQLGRLLRLPGLAVRTTNLPLSMQQIQEDQRRAVLEQIAPQLSDRPWESDVEPWNRPPGVLIVGLGVLGPGHWSLDRPGSPPRGIEEDLNVLRRDFFDMASIADVCFNLMSINNFSSKASPPEPLLRAFAEYQ